MNFIMQFGDFHLIPPLDFHLIIDASKSSQFDYTRNYRWIDKSSIRYSLASAPYSIIDASTCPSFDSQCIGMSSIRFSKHRDKRIHATYLLIWSWGLKVSSNSLGFIETENDYFLSTWRKHSANPFYSSQTVTVTSRCGENLIWKFYLTL